jgi:hypothetical protein
MEAIKAADIGHKAGALTRYSLQPVIDFSTRGNAADVNLGTIAVD